MSLLVFQGFLDNKNSFVAYFRVLVTALKFLGAHLTITLAFFIPDGRSVKTLGYSHKTRTVILPNFLTSFMRMTLSSLPPLTIKLVACLKGSSTSCRQLISHSHSIHANLSCRLICPNALFESAALTFRPFAPFTFLECLWASTLTPKLF